MLDEKFVPSFNGYIGEVVLEYENQMKRCHTKLPEFAVQSYYAGLRLRELRSRLEIILGYCDRHGITGSEYEKCKRLVKSFDQPKR